jgi:alpha-beta hydrolase superfamily lysophospholipase
MEHRTGTIINDREKTIFYQSWRPEGEPRAIILIAHGYGEHSSRYQEAASFFVEKGITVYAVDHEGHGQSEGVRADIKQIEDYVYDLRKIVGLIREQEVLVPLFLVGHSMGGGIALLFGAWFGELLSGLVLSAAGVKVGEDVSPMVKIISRVVARLLPTMPLVEFQTDVVSRDETVVENIHRDPLVYHGKIRARMGYQLLRIEPLFHQYAHQITLPVLIMHGSDDRNVLHSSSRMVYEEIGSEDKKLHTFEGLYHDLFHEPEKQQVLEAMLEWIQERIPS